MRHGRWLHCSECDSVLAPVDDTCDECGADRVVSDRAALIADRFAFRASTAAQRQAAVERSRRRQTNRVHTSGSAGWLVATWLAAVGLQAATRADVSGPISLAGDEHLLGIAALTLAISLTVALVALVVWNQLSEPAAGRNR